MKCVKYVMLAALPAILNMGCTNEEDRREVFQEVNQVFHQLNGKQMKMEENLRIFDIQDDTLVINVKKARHYYSAEAIEYQALVDDFFDRYETVIYQHHGIVSKYARLKDDLINGDISLSNARSLNDQILEQQKNTENSFLKLERQKTELQRQYFALTR